MEVRDTVREKTFRVQRMIEAESVVRGMLNFTK